MLRMTKRVKLEMHYQEGLEHLREDQQDMLLLAFHQRKLRQSSTLKLMRTKNGLLFRNSILFFIMKNRNKLF
jgi:tRNA (Thr-GGU) A37 N-methylase